MEIGRFDRWTRTVSLMLSRRGLASALGFAAIGHPGRSAAKKKKRKEKLRRNQFGCVNVGGACRGKDAVCCSGICQGQKPKKGKPDKSRCVAHNVLDCPAGADVCHEAATPCGTAFGFCLQTTGQASFCGNGGPCNPCTKDVECETVAGPGAACVVCDLFCPFPGNPRLCAVPAA